MLIGELVHVNADLGDQRLGGGLTDAGHLVQQRDDLGERAYLLLDLLIEVGDETIERLDMCPEQAQHEAMMLGHVTVERLLQRLALRLETTAGQRRELERVLFAVDQRLDHVPARGAHHVSRHR